MLSRNDAGILVVVPGSSPGARRNLVDTTTRVTGGTITLRANLLNHNLPPMGQDLGIPPEIGANYLTRAKCDTFTAPV